MCSAVRGEVQQLVWGWLMLIFGVIWWALVDFGLQMLVLGVGWPLLGKFSAEKIWRRTLISGPERAYRGSRFGVLVVWGGWG